VAYRGGVKETAFSGAFALRDELTRAASTVFAADPLYSNEELEDHGFAPWRRDAVDAAIIQADHAEYANLQAEDLPGLRVPLDGCRTVDASRWRATGVRVVRLGEGRR
jgi:UDP-N-acetyl-D-glucosamine dehydrogenase